MHHHGATQTSTPPLPCHPRSHPCQSPLPAPASWRKSSHSPPRVPACCAASQSQQTGLQLGQGTGASRSDQSAAVVGRQTLPPATPSTANQHAVWRRLPAAVRTRHVWPHAAQPLVGRLADLLALAGAHRVAQLHRGGLGEGALRVGSDRRPAGAGDGVSLGRVQLWAEPRQ